IVSKARLDLPEPERPVTTMSLSRGISTDMFLRLWTRAPCTAMVVRVSDLAGVLATLEFIRRFPHVDECQFLHYNVAHLREQDGRGDLADEALVGQVFARNGHALQVEVALEVGFDLGRGAGFAHLAQVV